MRPSVLALRRYAHPDVKAGNIVLRLHVQHGMSAALSTFSGWARSASSTLSIWSFGVITSRIGPRSGVISVRATSFLGRVSAYEPLATRFRIGAAIGIPIASLVINRRLYHIANVSVVSLTRNDKRKNILIDLAIGLGIPVLGMALCEPCPINEALL